MADKPEAIVNHLGPVVQRVDNFIRWMNPYPADKIGAFLILIGQRAKFIHWIGIYPLDKVVHSSYNRAQDVVKTRTKKMKSEKQLQEN